MRYCLCNHAERVHREDVGCTRCACTVFEGDPLYEPAERCTGCGAAESLNVHGYCKRCAKGACALCDLEEAP